MTSEMQEFKRAYFAQTGRMAREAMEAKARSGIYPLKLPIGYKRVFMNGEERIEVDPETAPLVRLAFEHIARKRASLSKVLATVRAKGLKGHSGAPISWGAFHRMLTNPFYTGFYSYGSQVFKGRHNRLVSQETLQTVNAALQNRIKR